MKEEILQKLPVQCPWRETVHWYASIGSTNAQAKRMAKEGAPHGTVLIAGSQTAGRGRLGRSFQSANGGAYLSVVLRPNCPPEELMHLTCAVAVAMVQAIEAACGICADIKWINDLVWRRKKLGGILTELAVDAKTGLVEFAIVGIGINCTQQPEDFPPELRTKAASLSMAAGRPVTPLMLLPEMVSALHQMWQHLTSDKGSIMDAYRQRCITLGSPIQVLRNGTAAPGTALSISDDGSLLVQYGDGRLEGVSSGEVSVRGFYDYV